MFRPRHILTSGVLLVLFATPGRAQTGMLTGTVIDSERNPISGVQVTVTSTELSSFRKNLKTDKKGQFRLRFQATQAQYEFELLFEKPGYASFSVAISPSATRQMREEWVMKQSETRVVESHGDLGSVVTGSSNVAVPSPVEP